MTELRVQILDNIRDVGLDVFRRKPYALLTDPPQGPIRAEGLVVRSSDVRPCDVSNNLVVAARAGVEVGNLPVPYLTSIGVPVLNAPFNANAVAEMVLGALLTQVRNLIPAARFVGSLDPASPSFKQDYEGGKKAFAGIEIKGRTILVIGLGRIGSLVAQNARANKMKVLGFDPFITPADRRRLGRFVGIETKMAGLLQQLAAADFVTIHTSLSDETRGLVARPQLEAMKPGAVLLNFARGDIVDLGALVEALACGVKYVTDFPIPTLIGHSNVLAFPHNGASTEEAEDDCARIACERAAAVLTHGIIDGSVNFPKMDQPMTTQHRLTVVQVGGRSNLRATIQSGAVFARTAYFQRARGLVTYTAVDLAGPPRGDMLMLLRAIPSVAKVRCIQAA